MSAREMFEKLGYKQEKGDWIEYFKNEDAINSIIDYLKSKEKGE